MEPDEGPQGLPEGVEEVTDDELGGPLWELRQELFKFKANMASQSLRPFWAIRGTPSGQKVC